MVTQAISPINPVLKRSDVVNTDASKDAFVASTEIFYDKIPPLAIELNTAFGQVNTTFSAMNTLEQSAQSAADIALALANFKGIWLVGTAYTVPSAVWLAGRYYSAIAPSTGVTPPNATYWALIPGIDDTTPSLESTYSGTKIQDLHDSQTTAIANLASASGSISNTATPVFAPISTTPADLPFTVVTPSTNSAVFTFDDTANTITFLKDGVFNYSSPVTFGASTIDARVVTFNIVDTTVVTAGSFIVGVTYTITSVGTTDFTLIGASANTVGISFTATGAGTGTGTANAILGSQPYNVEIAAGTTTTIPANTLFTVGANGIPSAPLTIKVQVKVDAGATVDLISFTSTLITNSIVNEGALADAIHAATVKSAPIDADEFSFLNSVGGAWSLVKLTYAQLKAALFASPALTGVPTTTTAAADTDTTQVASTAYVIGTAGRIRRMTAVAPNTTAVDFTGIPSWVKKITVVFAGLSASSTSNIQVQIGSSLGMATSGYVSTAWIDTGGAVSSTTAFLLTSANNTAYVWSGSLTLYNINANLWVASLSGGAAATYIMIGGGYCTIGAVLDRLRITMADGTSVFDQGTINVIYEG